MLTPKLRIALAFVSVGFIGCNAGAANTGTGTTNKDFTPVLEDTVSGVILPTYHDLLAQAELLFETVQSLHTNDDLLLARTQWFAARHAWEQSEAFLYGPVSDLGLDPALDSWPVDRVQLDQVLASSLDLGAETISANLGGGLKGFHTIEYLLFGVGGTQTAATLLASPRKMAYLTATVEALRNDAQKLYLAWAPEGDDFGTAFASSGKPGGRYFSSADGLQQLLNGCVDITDEVANGKLADPFKERNPELVESQFANSSLSDFADNLRSVDNIYTAKGRANSLSTLVSEKDPALDQQVRTAIANAVAAIVAISPTNELPFSQAILDPARAPLIEAAQAAVRHVGVLMSGQVRSTILGQ